MKNTVGEQRKCASDFFISAQLIRLTLSFPSNAGSLIYKQQRLTNDAVYNMN
jgi:hypothetical protein